MNAHKVICECHTDRLFLSVLLGHSDAIEHQSGKGKALKRLKKVRQSIIVVDHDEEPPRFSVQDYPLYAVAQARNQNRILYLKKNLESFLLATAREVNLHLKNFGLPDTFDGLHNLSVANLKPNLKQSFRNFFKALAEKSKTVREIQTLLRENIDT